VPTVKIIRLVKKYRGAITIITALGVFAAGGLVLWAASLRIPDLDTFDERIVRQSTKIYDRTGEILLFDVHENVQRTVVSFEDISRHIKNATVAIEDSEFYEHRGVKPSAILRATIVNIGSGEFRQGGSTITQQVVKNSLLTTEKTIARKLKEWALSLKLEQVLSKEEILTLYLNETPYGGNLYGIEEATQSFFDKSARDLTLPESAYLAALPQAPTYYSPYGNNLGRLEQRKNLVLRRMRASGFITNDEYEDAAEEEVKFQPREDVGIKAPHFVIYVRELLEQKYGKRAIEERGLRVITTLDWKLQQKAQEIVKRHALENEEEFNAENAGLVSINPKTGHILVMVGSRDYFDEDIQGNFNVTLTHRQPGSAFKPFVYATSFKKGYTPETIVFDLPTEFSTQCSVDGQPLSPSSICYSPVNYIGVFNGPLSLRDALAQSINVASVKVLYLAGIDESIKTARDLGITSLTNRDQYGLTLVLGGGEVSPLEMASAYGVFANDGVRNEPTPILRVEDSSGNIIDEFEKRSSQVLDVNIARIITDILSDNDARSPVFGSQSFLYFPGRDVAAKTGTTNDFRDAWVIGYTPNVSAAAWAGNNNNSPMEERAAVTIVAPMWKEFMVEAMEKLPDERFSGTRIEENFELKPILRGTWQGGESFFIDSVSKKLATKLTPSETLEERVTTSVHSILFWIDKDNPRGRPLTDPSSDPQFTRWEIPVRAWAIASGFQDENNLVVPTETDDIHVEKNFPKMQITGVDDGQIFPANFLINISAKSTGKFPIQSIEYYLNGRYLGASDRTPFSFSFNTQEGVSGSSDNILRVVGTDSVFNRGEVSVSFEITP